MFHRFSTWWRALGVVLLSLATVTWPTAAHAAPTTSFTVLHQDAVAVLSLHGTSHFDMTVKLPSPDSAAIAQVTIYPRILTRSEITPILAGTGSTSKPSATTGNFTLKCNTRHAVTLSIALFTKTPGRVKSPCTNRPARLRLPCNAESCDGVYPLSYSVTSNGTTTTEWSLLAVQASAVPRPLHLDWISTLDPSSWRHGLRAIMVLKAITDHSRIPLTLTADYRTLSKALNATDSIGVKWRQALLKALDSPLHRIVASPPSNIDFGGLVAGNLATQVTLQLSLEGQLLQTLSGRFVDAPVVLSGSPTLSGLEALTGSGVSDVVLPESALSIAPSNTLNWGAPFHVQGAGSLSVLSTDQPLNQLATDSNIEPGRRAALTLDTLAFLHFEAPNAPAIRSVVVQAPVALTSATYMNDLLAGLANNPFVAPSTLVPSFSSSLVATNGAPATRTLTPSVRSSWSSHNLFTLRTLIGAVTSYAQAVTSKSLSDSLRVAVASAEIEGGSGARQSAIDNANQALTTQLHNFSIDPSAITLAGPGTALPITLLSRAPYTVTAVVHLVTNGLKFPKGKSVVVTLNSPTTSIRVPAVSGRGSSVTLQVILTTPNGQVVLAHAAVQVHIAGASLVGYLITFASLLVLALWWWRTYRRGSKGRHAR